MIMLHQYQTHAHSAINKHMDVSKVRDVKWNEAEKLLYPTWVRTREPLAL